MRRLDATIFSTEVFLTLSGAEWREVMRKGLHGAKVAVPSGPVASTFRQDGGAEAYVIHLPPMVRQWSLNKRIGVVAHECQHVWQAIKALINEDSPGHEMEACTVQWLVEWVCEHLQLEGWLVND